MDIERLETKQSKILFGFCVAIVLAFICFILFQVIYPNEAESAKWILISKYILETLFSSIIVSVVLGGFILWIAPKKVQNAEMKVLQPYQIRDYHEDCRTKTGKWWYDGGSGRFTREETLPDLATKCKEKKQDIHVCIHILNPENEAVCKAYAKYRRRLGDPKEKASTIIVRCDLLATIVSAYFWKEQNACLRIKIYLKNYFSIFRKEFSDNMILITREDPTKPAIVYQNDSDFYKAYESDLIQGFKQYAQLDENQEFATKASTLNEITTQEIENLLTALKINTGIGENELKQILEFVQTKTSPYSKK